MVIGRTTACRLLNTSGMMDRISSNERPPVELPRIVCRNTRTSSSLSHIGLLAAYHGQGLSMNTCSGDNNCATSHGRVIEVEAHALWECDCFVMITSLLESIL